MQLGLFQELGVAGGAEQGEAALLVGHVFGMLERQVEERPLGRRDYPVEAFAAALS